MGVYKTCLVVLLIVGTSSAVEDHSRSKRMSHAELAEIENFPYQVALFQNSEYICGGSIISQKWALTAAHCVESRAELWNRFGTGPNRFGKETDELARSITLKSGNTNKYDGYIHEVDKIVIHPKRNPIEYKYDFGLLKIKDEFKIGLPNVNKVKLAVKEPKKNTPVKLAGWGWIRVDDPTAILHSAKFNIVGRKRCQKEFNEELHGNSVVIHKYSICAEYDEGNACPGDSGSALVTEDGIQVGITSFAIITCDTRSPVAFANVAIARKWIEHVMEADEN